MSSYVTVILSTDNGEIRGVVFSPPLDREAVFVEEHGCNIMVTAHVQDILRLFDDTDRRHERKDAEEHWRSFSQYNLIRKLEEMFEGGYPPYGYDAFERALRLYWTCTHDEELEWRKIFPREGTEEYRVLKNLLDEDL